MRIVFDLDGTLTDFNSFIDKNAIPYFMNKYGLKVINENGLEIEEIFEINSQLSKRFWFSPYFLKFSLFGDLRKGVSKCIKKLLKEGHTVEIHSSRAETSKGNLVGRFARICTLLQLAFNGISLNSVRCYFYENDDKKLEHLIEIKPDFIFDDKPIMVEAFDRCSIKCICVSGRHNKQITENENIKIINDFEKTDINKVMKDLVGERKFNYFTREAQSEIEWRKLRTIYPFVLAIFNPLVIHKDRLINVCGDGVIYAPNHQKTLDPLVITPIIDKSMHYVVLKRFMDGKDSIFNNSKNQFLCRFTSELFRKLDFFPVERKSDSPKASNFKAITDINGFLSIKSNVGIFPEGTTRKINGEFFGEFDDSFIRLAKKNDSWIQPILILWGNDSTKKKVVVNFGNPFKVGKMTVEEAMKHYLEIQRNCLEENKSCLLGETYKK